MSIKNTMQRRITKQEVQKMQELYAQGKTQQEIAKVIGCSQNAVSYWLLDEEGRKKKIKCAINYFRNLPVERKHEIYLRRLPYMKEYMINRYKNDMEFRKRTRERTREYLKRKNGKRAK